MNGFRTYERWRRAVISGIEWARDNQSLIAPEQFAVIESVAERLKELDPEAALEADALPNREQTMILALDREQASSVAGDIAIALARDSESVLLLSSNKPAVQTQMQRVMDGEEGSLADLPEPDVIAINTVWTIGLPVTTERLAEVIQAESPGASNGGPQDAS